MFGKCCAYCGNYIHFEELEVDHIIPRIRGGRDVMENYYPSCRPCNISKGGNTVEEFRKRLTYYYLDQINNNSKFRLMLRHERIILNMEPVRFYFETMDK